MLQSMSRPAAQIARSLENREVLKRLGSGRTEPKQTVDRVRIVLGCLESLPVQQVAR